VNSGSYLTALLIVVFGITTFDGLGGSFFITGLAVGLIDTRDFGSNAPGFLGATGLAGGVTATGAGAAGLAAATGAAGFTGAGFFTGTGFLATGLAAGLATPFAAFGAGFAAFLGAGLTAFLGAGFGAVFFLVAIQLAFF